MIKIEREDLEKIAKEYEIRLKDWLNYNSAEKYRKGTTKDKLEKISRKDTSAYGEMISYIHTNLPKLILLKPQNFDSFEKDFKNQFENEISKYDAAEKEYGKVKNNKNNISTEEKKARDKTSFYQFKVTMESFYKNFFKDNLKLKDKKDKKDPTITNGRWLASRLAVNVCPYCNRSYTFTINEEDAKTRPQFDHFLPKSKYPYFALSFYNLVPSCPVCNLMKGEKEITINPYEGHFGDQHKFILKSDGVNPSEWVTNKDKIKIGFNNCKNKNIKFFGLVALYNEHIDFVEEIIDKAQAYNSSYYDSLIESYQGLGKQPAEIDRFVWGVYLETAEHKKRPLSKLTRDLLDQFDIK